MTNLTTEELLKHARQFVFTALKPEVIAMNPHDAYLFEVRVEWRNENQWAVLDSSGDCYNRKLEDTYESQPSSRTKKFLKDHRFTLEEAIEIAQKVTKIVKINRFNAEDWNEFVLNNPETE